jgi:hypothetical protein
MRFGDPDLRVRTPGLFAAIHERDHAGEIGLIGQYLQVVEQLHVRLEPVRNARRLIDVRPLAIFLLLRLLDPAFDVTE